MKTYYEEVINNFTKRAKKQYKKYESYLDNSEDLLNFCLENTKKALDLVPMLLENALLRNPFDVKKHVEESTSIEEKENVNSIVKKFSKSEFLLKKNLFVDVKTKMKINLGWEVEDIQTKYDRFLQEYPVKLKCSYIDQ